MDIMCLFAFLFSFQAVYARVIPGANSDAFENLPQRGSHVNGFITSSPVSTSIKGRQRRRARCDPNLVEPIVIFPHQRVKIACSKCSSFSRPPAGAAWRFQSYTASNDEKLSDKLKAKLGVKSDEKRNNELTIIEASIENAGRYYCKSGARYLGNYDVTYITNPQFHLVIQGDKSGDYNPLPETRSNTTNELIMNTVWEQWSSCNQCGQFGERSRIGLCHAQTRLKEFPAGVPCRSNVVPYGERSRYDYSHRRDEKMISTCNIPCPPKAKSSKTGKLIRTFALTEGVPTLPELVKRRVYYENIGDDAELVCPEVGSTHGVRWMNGSSALQQLELAKSGGRYRIDHINRLVIKDVQASDAGNFTCWFENKKIAVVLIKVVKPPSLDEDAEENATYLALVLVFLVIFYIAFGVYRNRNLQTIQ